MLLIFETHPIQYKAPIYQRLQQLRPGTFKVIYGTDGSMRDGFDKEFGRKITWDAPLLEGYPYEVLHNQKGPALVDFYSLSGKGILRVLQKEKPRAVLLAPFLFAFDVTAFFYAVLFRIPIWIRVETQDEAMLRPQWKGDVRSAFYWLTYKFVSHAFFIGLLNRDHLGRHGIKIERMSFAPYASPLTFPSDPAAKQELRDATRAKLGFKEDDYVLLFSGKLIDKKNPGLILAGLALVPEEVRRRTRVVYVGSGELEPALRREAEKFPGQVHFVGFVNQSEMPACYLAADVLVLPSRRMGETWGLVVNEALSAGCGVIVSSAVGCSTDFRQGEHVRIIPDNSINACAQAITSLSKMKRSFDWSQPLLAPYTIEAAAQAIATKIDSLPQTRPAT
jgi:glycosyltransferase involved in cell wall biosynthesis